MPRAWRRCAALGVAVAGCQLVGTTGEFTCAVSSDCPPQQICNAAGFCESQSVTQGTSGSGTGVTMGGTTGHGMSGSGVSTVGASATTSPLASAASSSGSNVTSSSAGVTSTTGTTAGGTSVGASGGTSGNGTTATTSGSTSGKCVADLASCTPGGEPCCGAGVPCTDDPGIGVLCCTPLQQSCTQDESACCNEDMCDSISGTCCLPTTYPCDFAQCCESQDAICLTGTEGEGYCQTPVTLALVGDGGRGLADGDAETAMFAYPEQLVLDSDGGAIVADTFNNAIRYINNKLIVSTIAGNENPGFENGDAGTAEFDLPTGVALDDGGNIYVADTYNRVIRIIEPPGIVSKWIGSRDAGFLDGPPGAAAFDTPVAVIADGLGNLYVADQGNNAIRKIILKTGEVSTIAGMGPNDAGYVNGDSTVAQFNRPTGLALDALGNLYVADAYNSAIRVMTPNGDVSTVAGLGPNADGLVDGDAGTARFIEPEQIASDSFGNLLVADEASQAIRLIDVNHNVTTIAGTGKFGLVNGSGTLNGPAEFGAPTGVAVFAVTASGSGETIYVSDTFNMVIREIVLQ
jgi:hypothetical protein